jgi:outer membrane murein-binding lipoprotein Lpp
VKRTIAACFAGVLVFAGMASAATPAQRIAKLEKQVKTLTATVKKQQSVMNCVLKVSNKCQTLKSTVTNLDGAVNASLYVEFCLIGVTADAIQSTWTTLDQASGTSLFGPQQTISDANTCGPLQITRQGIRTPPSASVFSALTPEHRSEYPSPM